MEVIVIESQAFKKLIEEITIIVIKETERKFKQEEWIGEIEAKKLLGIKSKGKLQQLRDSISIEFSQFGKIIRYSRSSILSFLESNRIGLDKF